MHRGSEAIDSPSFRFTESLVERKPVPSENSDQSEIWNERKSAIFDHSDVEAKVKAIVDWHTAESLFDRYKTDFVSAFGAVPVPENMAAYAFIKSRPILFLSIISSTSFAANVEPAVQHQLAELLRGVLAEATWKNGEKSLEIVQAMQVSALFADYSARVDFIVLLLSKFLVTDDSPLGRMLVVQTTIKFRAAYVLRACTLFCDYAS